MEKYRTFGDFWEVYSGRPLQDREHYYMSLTKQEQKNLVSSLFNDGWTELLVQNIIDRRIDEIKETFGIDVLDVRIQAIKLKRAFIIERRIWELIEQYLLEFEDFYDTNVIFGNLKVMVCGRKKQFCRIRFSH